MATVDIFNSDYFGIVQMTAAIAQQPYVPTMLADLGLFDEDGIDTLTAVIEFSKGQLSVIPVTPRNAPPASIPHDKRSAIPILVPHIPVSDGLLADAVQGRRGWSGGETARDTIEAARDRLLLKMRRSLDYTIEAHRLSALNGQFYNADGTTTDLFAYFGVAPTVIPMNLDVATTKVRQKSLTILTAIEDALEGTAYTDAIALCGKNFWSDFIEHAAVKDTFARAQDGAALRSDARAPLAFGGLLWTRYRGNSQVKINDDEALVVPRGVPDLLMTRFAPANYVETVNTRGLPYYAKSEPMPLGKGLTMEAQSNPLNIVTRPNAIIRLRRTN